MRPIKPKSSKSIVGSTAVTANDSASVETASETSVEAGENAEEKDWSEHISTEKTDKFKHRIEPVKGTFLFITDEYARELLKTEEGSAARKEVRATNGAKRKQNKKDAEEKRASFKLELVKQTKILDSVGISLNVDAMSQPIYVKKDAMTIRGVTFKSPIGMGGARFYINHRAKKNPKWANPVNVDKLLEFGQLVSLASAVAAQRAGTEAMKALAPLYDIDLAGLEADSGDDDGSED